MKKAIIIIGVVLILSVCLFGCSKKKADNNEPTPTAAAQTEASISAAPSRSVNTPEATLLSAVNYFDSQAQTDANLQAEADKGYPFSRPLVVVNPYGNSPLTAVAIFSTDTDTGGKVTVKGKAPEDNITGTFPAAKSHIVPIYGLYPADNTEVELTLDDGTTSAFTVTTEAVDISDASFTAEMSEPSGYDYSKLSFVLRMMGDIYAIDSKGDMRWYMKKGGTLGAKALKNGHLIMPSNYMIRPIYYMSGLIEIDLLGKVYYEYAIPGGMHHDIVEMPDGNLLVASNEPDSQYVEDYVVELDRQTGEVIWDLDMKNLIGPMTEGSSINRTDEDWLHNNGLWYDAATDTVLLSSRHTDAIYAVDKASKTLKWILGDPEGWSDIYQKYFFKPVGNNFEWQYAQHEVSMLTNGDIMCFDNGAGRTKSTKPRQEVTGDKVFSRAVVFHIDTANMTIKQVREFGKELGPEAYSEWVSGAIELDNDPNNIFVTFGSNLYNPETKSYDYGPSDMFIPGLVPSTKLYQVKDNKVIFKAVLDQLSYRSLRLAPYAEAGVYDITAQGSYLGDYGVSTAAATVDITGAAAAQNVSLSLDPTKLTMTAMYNTELKDNLPDSYIVFNKADGTNLTYKLNQSAAADGTGKVTVTVNGWVSTTGLEGQTFNVYVVFDRTVYNTGYYVQF